METPLEEKVKCIPATEEQKKQYSQHINGNEFTDMPSADFPIFSKEQLNSVPDIVSEVPLNEYEKKMILLNDFEYSASSNWSTTFSLDKDNYLISKYHDVDQNNEVFESVKNIYKSDVLYIPQNEIELNQNEIKKISSIAFDKDQFENIADKLNKYYEQAGESMWNFNHSKGKEILEFTMYLQEFPENVRNIVLDYLLLDCPARPDFNDYSEDMFNHETLFEQAIENYINKELPDFNYKEKSLSQVLNSHGVDIEKFPLIKVDEVNYLNILLNDVSRIYADNNKELQKETVKLEAPNNEPLSTESNLSIDNIYGFKPTIQQKEDLNNGKGITGEIQGRSYFIMLSTQEKNKGTLQILSLEKAKEFNLLKDFNNNKVQKNTGLRV
ncbi:hypothetical protein K6T82_23790 [Flavobacterium sp. 17A]|uniref:Uncharacterized protein n=1 Tax=Flavobacterium potami TaxID=2872310 RepID=A0A9X1HFV6_9FLAO|nr:hypothetical protein [Flavobacterium potami]MBZ4037800.1 hypothetical protein [Flavobacterium potami]